MNKILKTSFTSMRQALQRQNIKKNKMN